MLRSRRWFVLCVLAILPIAAMARPLSGHPRLWIDPDDVARLRAWAVESNPLWSDGLHRLGVDAASDMDDGAIPGDDNGGSTYSPVNTEAYAALFAFLANVDPDASSRDEWAGRASALLMHVVDRVDACLRSVPPVASGPYCSVAFPVSDRSRWQGAAFPLAVDWLASAHYSSGQPVLSASDKATIRRVFIWWSYLNLEAYPNPYNNPPQDSLPVGTIGEPLLRLDDPRRYRLRFAGNNYFAGHMRQLGLMALALDPADDVADPLSPPTYLKPNANGELEEFPFDDADGRLTGFLRDALDGWLFMQDYLLRHDARGGLPAEGMEYAATSLGIPSQFLLALETAGYADADGVAAHGEHVAGFASNAFYRAIVTGYLHSLSPAPFDNPNRGAVYWPAWFGDGEFYYQSDSMGIFGPLGLHAARVGDTRTLDAIRWIERHVPPGGAGALLSRARSREDLLEGILYFMLFDPGAADAPDPRGELAPSFWSEGLGRLLSRTDASASATWFDFKLGWDTIDHQHGDGLMIELYRNGEWLTKGALGYGLEGGATDYKNSLAIENTRWVGENPESSLARRLVRGAQMPQGRAAADPEVLFRSEHAAYSYATADATALYDAWYGDGDETPAAEHADDVVHASRSLVWLKPDRIVVYDRATTSAADRFKRFWLNLPDRLPSFPTIAGNVATGTTPGGQKLFATSVLPASKTLSIETHDAEINLERGNLWSLGDEDPILQRRQYIDPNTGDPVPDTYENYATRLRIDATGGPADVRFLTVLEAADAGAQPTAASAFASVAYASCATPAGAFDGVVSGSEALLFRRDLASESDCFEYVVPIGASLHTLTGLAPWGRYSVSRALEGANQRVRVASGGPLRADQGGVLRFAPASPPPAAPQLILIAHSLDEGELAFPAAVVGATREEAVLLFNLGTAPLAIASIALEIDALDAYSLENACGATLAPDASCEVRIGFSPQAIGFASARLVIVSDSIEPPAPIRIAGTAIATPTGDAIFADGFEF